MCEEQQTKKSKNESHAGRKERKRVILTLQKRDKDRQRVKRHTGRCFASQSHRAGFLSEEQLSSTRERGSSVKTRSRQAISASSSRILSSLDSTFATVDFQSIVRVSSRPFLSLSDMDSFLLRFDIWLDKFSTSSSTSRTCFNSS